MPPKYRDMAEFGSKQGNTGEKAFRGNEARPTTLGTALRTWTSLSLSPSVFLEDAGTNNTLDFKTDILYQQERVRISVKRGPGAPRGNAVVDFHCRRCKAAVHTAADSTKKRLKHFSNINLISISNYGCVIGDNMFSSKYSS